MQTTATRIRKARPFKRGVRRAGGSACFSSEDRRTVAGLHEDRNSLIPFCCGLRGWKPVENNTHLLFQKGGVMSKRKFIGYTECEVTFVAGRAANFSTLTGAGNKGNCINFRPGTLNKGD
jgi:hypothetical protein